jgi:hypothetical protein
MTTDAGGVFHKEIVICKPNVTLVGRVSNKAVEKLHKDRKLQDAINPKKKGFYYITRWFIAC